MGDVDIRPASAAEVPIAAAILEEATAWATAHGYSTWEAGSSAAADGAGRARLEAAQAADALYLAWRDGTAIATFTLLTADELYWPGVPPDALYLHRFAVRRAEAGAGRAIVEWVAAETRRRGRDHVRLDCVADDSRIRRYYEAAAFRWRADVEVGGRLMSLYERAVD